MASVNASMEQYYAARAACYDAVYNRPERHDDILATKALLAQRCAGKSVLEGAAGTGYWTPCIAVVASRVVAFDATPEPLAFVRLRPGTATLPLPCQPARHVASRSTGHAAR